MFSRVSTHDASGFPEVDVSGAQETESQLDSAIKTVNNLVSTLRLDVDARRRKVLLTLRISMDFEYPRLFRISRSRLNMSHFDELEV